MKLTKKMIAEAIKETLNEQFDKRVYQVYIYKPNKRGFADENNTTIIGYYESDNIVVRAASEVSSYGWDEGEGWQVGVEEIKLNHSWDREAELNIIRAAQALSQEVGFDFGE